VETASLPPELATEFADRRLADPAALGLAPAGSIVAFSSVTMHRTGANTTDQPRRALVCQYTAEPLLRPDTGRAHNRAVKMPVPVAA
jgi:ectoine hydroxylase-related dioxygenase (phytanoyl-CoA dioxygenase family)